MTDLAERARAALRRTEYTDWYVVGLSTHADTIREALKLAAKAAPDQEREEVAHELEIWTWVDSIPKLDLINRAIRLLRTPAPVVPAKIAPIHETADAFWKAWRENGETHKHGYYESTWIAINAALAASPTKEGNKHG